MSLWLIAVRFGIGVITAVIWERVRIIYVSREANPTARTKDFGYLAGMVAGFVWTLGVEYVTGLYRYPGIWPWLLGLFVLQSYYLGWQHCREKLGHQEHRSHSEDVGPGGREE